MSNGEAMSQQYRDLRSDPTVQRLMCIHDRIVAAIHANDRAEVRRARRCYRRALARVARIERWRRLNGYAA